MDQKNNLFYSPKNAWVEGKKDFKHKAFEFAEGYKTFLDGAKTEREFVDESIKQLKEKDFVDFDELIDANKEIATGTKVFRNIHGKSLLMGVIGSDGPDKGFNIVGAHIDSPRLDLKPEPLYESSNLTLLRTHYFGGIKKYQWTAIPLALHGVVTLSDGKTIKVTVGEKETDPVFTISDLLPHLGAKQMGSTMREGISGENLQVIAGHIPYESKEKINQAVKLNVLTILNETYGIKEEDFICAELEVVPAFKARDIGFDRGLVGAYGQDDRSCAYIGLKAITEIKNPQHTAICYLSDKEEVGSEGNTGAHSKALENFISDLCLVSKNRNNEIEAYKDSSFLVRRCLSNSRMLSADVTAAVDPLYSHVHELQNSIYLGQGIGLSKYTGSGGKSSSSDCSSEYFAEIKNLFNKKNVIWKHAELGKIDEGGGGTIAKFAANLGINVIDCGVPLLSMHSPYEVSSKADIFSTYRAYRKFYKIDNYKTLESKDVKDKTKNTIQQELLMR